MAKTLKPKIVRDERYEAPGVKFLCPPTAPHLPPTFKVSEAYLTRIVEYDNGSARHEIALVVVPKWSSDDMDS